ncbi:Receptor-like protein EIX1 [Linum grandiflorum]
MRFFCYGTYGVRCNQAEREALLTFKADLQDPSRRLSSWVNGSRDCCKWSGVVCDDLTGRVTELHLRSPDRFLKRSWLKFLGSMTNLQTLYLDGSGFGGLIPHQLGNLSNLLHLGLMASVDAYVLYADSLQWLSGLPSLEYLDLDKVDLSIASDWLSMINTVPNLSRLYLSDCQINDDFPLIHVNLSSLSVLDLSYNRFGPSSFPSWVSHLKSLTSLALRGNLRGAVPDELRNLTSLRALKLSENKFNGTIPNWLFGLRHLQDLDFHSSNLVGDVSNEIGNMTSLVNLDLSFNYGLKLEGGIPASFRSFCHLSSLKLSYVKLQQSVSEVLEILEECSSGTLERLSLSGCELFGQLTDRIGKFKRLKRLWLDGNSISGPLPMSFGELISLDYVSIARNQINGTIPKSFGKLADLQAVDISQNLMEGVVSEIHFANLKKLNDFRAAGNKIVFKAKPDWVPPKVLEILDMNCWQLGPGFPKWLQSIQDIVSLDMSNTGISESIPDWFWSMDSPYYYSLRIQNNSLTGEIPLSLGNCTSIVSIDLGDNKLEGNIPKWIGERLSRLAILNLRGNKFMGYVPEKLCHLQLLQILNLSHNYLFGEIPKQIISLVALNYLNLSHNSLSGAIPEDLASMKSLESLDMSENHLSGAIPPGMASLTFLNHLNLSYNNLSGRIPSGTQLQSFDPSSFIGNKGLCGSPVSVSCSRMNLVPGSGEGNRDLPGSGEGNGDYDLQRFSMSIMFGFAFGFWGIVGSIEVSERWRELCFGVLDRIGIKSGAL